MKRIVFSFVVVLLHTVMLQAQSIMGKWKTIDDETGNEKSIVEIFEENGKVYGKIIELFEEKNKNAICSNCSGINENKPYLGLIIINDLKKDGNEWNGGTILDPKTGKEYKCLIALESTNKLKVRGYVGFSLIGRTQYWQRIK